MDDLSLWLAIVLVVGGMVFDSLKKGKKKPVPKKPLPMPRPRMKQPRMEIPLPMPSRTEDGKGLGFEVPHLEGAPPVGPEPPVAIQDEHGVWHEAGSLLEEQLEAIEEERRDHQQDLARESREREIRAAEEAAYREQAKLSGTPAKRLPLQLTPEQALSAFALAEVLGKPKSLRRLH